MIEPIEPVYVHYDSVSSTNDIALSLAREGSPEGTIVIADRQTSGRGRRGRTWLDAPGQCVLMSVILRPQIDAAQMSKLTFLASLVVGDWIRESFRLDARLKWPNDVLIRDRKVCGILLELAGSAAVVGIGLNVNQTSFPSEISDVATSIALESRHIWDTRDLAHSLAEYLLVIYGGVLDSGFGGLLPRWRKRMWGLGKQIEIAFEDDLIRGVIRGVDDCGALLVADAQGVIHSIHAVDAIKTTRN